MAKKDPALLSKKCHFDKGGPWKFGDGRYRYQAWWCMSPEQRRAAAARYLHSTPGIPDSAYAYPIGPDGRPPKGRARRVLLWRHGHAAKRVAKHRAGGVAGARRRKRRRR